MTDVKTVRFEDGLFRLSRYRYKGGFDWWFIEHRCGRGGHWKWFSGVPEDCHAPCWACTAVVPDGLHAMFWFVKDGQGYE
jgi:hypothetical protein